MKHTFELNPDLSCHLQASDAGLPAPDLIIFLKLSAAAAASRKGYGEERYENTKFQERVHQQYKALIQQDPAAWTIFSADEDMDVLTDKVFKLLQALSACRMSMLDATPSISLPPLHLIEMKHMQ